MYAAHAYTAYYHQALKRRQFITLFLLAERSHEDMQCKFPFILCFDEPTACMLLRRLRLG